MALNAVFTLLFICLLSAPAFSQPSGEQTPWEAPEGWFYVMEFGPPEIFHLSAQSETSIKPVMILNSHRNGAILAKDLAFENLDQAILSWQWRVEKLPSKIAEDKRNTHDYISIAILFENGQDLSYIWSAELPEETSFRCPSQAFQDREAHVVVRSGEEELGKWIKEVRNILDDYKKYVGGDLSPIVQIWLISNTLLQGGSGKAEFSDIFVKQPSINGKPLAIL